MEAMLVKFTWRFGWRSKPPVAVEKKRPLLALVLGGGSVRAAAHVGVLSVLEREGIRPDIVVGTSGGAIVGACVAAGVPMSEVYEYFKSARWKDLARPSWGSRLSMLETDPLGALLERVVQARDFGQLGLSFAAVATDVLTGTTYTFTEGSLREALVASSAIPGLLEPVRRDGRLLVDGGVTDNLPIDVACDLGAGRIVAVDIMPLPDGTFEPQSVRDMLLLSWSIIERPTVAQLARADLVITPDLARATFSEFSQVEAIHQTGVQAAEKALPELRSILGMKAPTGST